MMTNKEHLKEIIRESRQYGKMSDPPIFFREVDESHFRWLIEQAERVQELEKELYGTEMHYGYKNMYGICNRDYAELNYEKKRYKQALVRIEEEINGKLEGLDAEDELKSAKQIAHKALEGDS